MSQFKRSFLSPEILQVSSMDCGVAAVSCLLSGYGVRCNYEWLREKCRTSVDGTSIDSIEDLCRELGVSLSQHIIPVDAVLNVMEGRYPLVAIVKRGTSLPHFVVVWNRVGQYLQVMDPAGGRRWMHFEDLKGDLFVHPLELPTESFRTWIKVSSLRDAIERRARALLSKERSVTLIQATFDQCDPYEVGAVDASLRLVGESKRRSRRADAAWCDQLFDGVIEAARRDAHTEPEVVPLKLWSIRVRGPEVVTTGAVLLAPLQVDTPVTAAVDPSSRVAGGISQRVVGPDGAGVRASDRPPSFWRDVAALLEKEGRGLLGMLLFGVVVTSFASTLEIVVYRAAMDAPRLFRTFDTRVGAAATVCLLALLVLGLEVSATVGAARLGRVLELSLRQATLLAFPRVDPLFLRSRPTSDLAYRAHSLAAGRSLPTSILQAMRGAGDLTITLLAIAWLDVRYLVPVTVGSLVLVASFFLSRSRLRELDTRSSVHASRLLNLFLDALRGPRPIRLHGYQDAFRGEQRRELSLFRRTGLDLAKTTALLQAVNATTGNLLLLSVFLVFVHGHGDPRAFVLLAFWAFRIPASLAALISFAQIYPIEQLSLTRLLEVTRYVPPLAPASAQAENPQDLSLAAGVALSFRGVSVVANGSTLLETLDLEIPRGQHVAIVGRSGAGKSTLVGLPLGLHPPTNGQLFVDGRPLTREELWRLRQVTAWVDPSIELWNSNVRDNLEYAAQGHEKRALLETLESADLLGVINKLESGLDTTVGSSGKLLSGGEGQRIRLGRALRRKRSELVVLDEAFRGLDRAARKRLVETARHTWASATLLFVSHDISHARLFDRVLVVEDGRIVEDGKPEALVQEASRFRELLLAEQVARQTLWGAEAWRRVRVGEGIIQDVS